MNEILLTAISTVSTAIGRSILGWAENALKDGELSNFEIAELAGTIVRITVIGFAATYGFNLEPFAGAMVAVVIDFVLIALKKVRAK